MYKVFEHIFDSWYDVVAWAWNTHKIEWNEDYAPCLTESDRHEACRTLEIMIGQEL